MCGRVYATGATVPCFDQVSLYDAFGWTRGAWSIGPGSATLVNTPFNLTGDSVGWGGQWGAITVAEPAGGSAGPPSWGAGQSGLMLLGYRFYSPDTGRFLTRDPTGYEGGLNLYAYCRNNPVMNADPMGFADESLWARAKGWAGQATSAVGNVFMAPFRYAWQKIKDFTRPKMGANVPTLVDV